MKTYVTEDNTIFIEIPESEFLKLVEENEDYNKVADTLLRRAFEIVVERRKENRHEGIYKSPDH